MRLDQYLAINHYFESRNQAAAAIKKGYFAVNGKVTTRPSCEVPEGAQVVQVKNAPQYVARSAHKLLHGFACFKPDWAGKIVADFGASTGGFCQVLLEHGVGKIYAVDIGTAQLHPLISRDTRVLNMEHVNARYMTAADFPEPIEAITADLSFISLKAVLPAIFKTLCPGGQAITLVKPQFEAGQAYLNKSGIVSDRGVHRKILADVSNFAAELGFSIRGICFSGLAGSAGNREYLIFMEKSAQGSIQILPAVDRAILMEDADE